MTSRRQARDLSRLLGVVTAVVVIAALYFARVVLLPLSLAVLFAFILTTPVRLFERVLGRTAAALLVVFLSVGLMTAIGWTVTQQFSAVVNQLPDYRANIKAKIDSVHWSKNLTLNNASETVKEISQDLTAPATAPGDANQKRRGAASPARPLPVQVITPPSLPVSSVQNLLEFLISALIIVVLTTFMLVRQEDLRDRLVFVAGAGHLTVMTHAIDDATRRVGKYLGTQLLVNGLYGLCVGVGLHFLGISGGLLWGVVVGVLRFLPYIGPPLGALMPVALSLAIFDGWARPLETVAMFIGLELVTAHVIEPLLYGAQTGLSSIAVLLAAIFWTALWGPIGLVLSTPLTVCVVVLGRHVPALSFLHVLLGDEPVLAPGARVYQRLLAGDSEEARRILEDRLKTEPIEKVYDSILIPALTLAERDRRRNELDETTERFVYESAKELIQQLSELPDAAHSAGGAQVQLASADGADGPQIICAPVGGAADEIAGAILAQLLRRAGYQARCLPQLSLAETLAEIAKENPAVVCLSAFPPLGATSARELYECLRAQGGNTAVVIGLWAFGGDPNRAAARIGDASGVPVSQTLADAADRVARVLLAPPADPASLIAEPSVQSTAPDVSIAVVP